MVWLRPARASFLLAAGVLSFAMMFAGDVIAETALSTPIEAVGLLGLALSAISMAGSVVTSMQGSGADAR